MDKKNLIIKLFKSLRGEKCETMCVWNYENYVSALCVKSWKPCHAYDYETMKIMLDEFSNL